VSSELPEAERTTRKAVSEKSYPAFDYLRAIAAIGVFISHTKYQTPIGDPCVQVFFALSGFLIGGILLRTKTDDLPRFYFNRAARIWIPYGIAIALIAAVTGLKQGFSDPKLAEFFFYMVTFVYNWFGAPHLDELRYRMPLDGTANHFWSICIEEQFYLVAPFLIVFAARRITALVFAAIVVCDFIVPNLFTSISLGVLLAMTDRSKWFLGACLVMVPIAYAFYGYYQWMPFVAVLIIAACSWTGPRSKLGEIAGGASFSFYLNHWIGLFAASALVKYGVGLLSATIVAFVISAALAVLHYEMIDRAIANARGRFFTQRRGALLCLTALFLVTIGLATGLAIANLA